MQSSEPGRPTWRGLDGCSESCCLLRIVQEPELRSWDLSFPAPSARPGSRKGCIESMDPKGALNTIVLSRPRRRLLWYTSELQELGHH